MSSTSNLVIEPSAAAASIASLAELPTVSEPVRGLLLLAGVVAGGEWVQEAPAALLQLARRAVQREAELEGQRARLERAEAQCASQAAQLALLASSSDAARTRLELEDARAQIGALQVALADGLEAQWAKRVASLSADNANLRKELASSQAAAAASQAAAAAAAAAAAGAAAAVAATPAVASESADDGLRRVRRGDRRE